MGLWQIVISGVSDAEHNVAEHLNDLVQSLEAHGHTVMSAGTSAVPEEEPDPTTAAEPTTEPPATPSTDGSADSEPVNEAPAAEEPLEETPPTEEAAAS